MNPYKPFVFLIFTAVGRKEQIKKQGSSSRTALGLPQPLRRLYATWILMTKSNGPAPAVCQAENGSLVGHPQKEASPALYPCLKGLHL